MEKYTFKIMPLSWFKRRIAEKGVQPIKANVSNFQLIDNHYCTIHALFDNNEEVTLEGRVSLSFTHGVGGQRFNERWTVQGFNNNGYVILLEVLGWQVT